MAIKPRTKLILWTRSGCRCAFPECQRKLYLECDDQDPDVILGEMAHIVGQGDDGPRRGNAIPGGDIDGYENLIMLCTEHHTIVDRQENKYTVDRLVQMRRDHERWVDRQLSVEERFRNAFEPGNFEDETVSSSLLTVERMPRWVFSAPCTVSERAVSTGLIKQGGVGFMAPFIIREKRLMTFCDLESNDSPFADLVDQGDVKGADAFSDWWGSLNHLRWYADLLNRSLNKMTGRKGLQWDKGHKRYYFEPDEGGGKKTIQYKTLSGRRSSLGVAWEPKSKKTGKGKGYWEHLAVSLRFEKMGDSSWCLSVRPERRFTKDGDEVLPPKRTGKKATSRKSRIYNIDYRQELHFWRDYFCNGTPRILFDFGGQSIVIPAAFVEPTVYWPGVHDDVPSQDEIKYEDDLFSYSEYQQLIDHRSGLDDE